MRESESDVRRDEQERAARHDVGFPDGREIEPELDVEVLEERVAPVTPAAPSPIPISYPNLA